MSDTNDNYEQEIEKHLLKNYGTQEEEACGLYGIEWFRDTIHKREIESLKLQLREKDEYIKSICFSNAEFHERQDWLKRRELAKDCQIAKQSSELERLKKALKKAIGNLEAKMQYERKPENKEYRKNIDEWKLLLKSPQP